MYLSSLKLWNFRKYGRPGEIDIQAPHLYVLFTPGLNVLVGENDSGKTAIIDSIKLVLKTHAIDWIKPSINDFHRGTSILRIELTISDMSESEASHFVEWLGWEENKPYLRLIYQARLKDGLIVTTDVKAGQSEDGILLSSEAKDYLRTTYLRPLRDANNELTAGRNSRISQILEGHRLLQKGENEPHELEAIAENANKSMREWFMSEKDGENSSKKQIIDVIDDFIHDFINTDYSSDVTLVDPEIKTILEKLSLGIREDRHLGLGTMNRLYMAAELLHLKQPLRDQLNLCLIEELEAHLHPQSQLKVISALQSQKGVQFILTTHSPNITSKLHLAAPDVNLLMCKADSVYSLSPGHTKLTKEDYAYLETFLDVTRSNLFFSKGLFLVEGWAEDIILPVLAKKMGHDFTKKEISIVNVGSTAYLRFAHIFMPESNMKMGVRVAAITDLDVLPTDTGFDEAEEAKKRQRKEDAFSASSDDVKLFIANHWTLEWCLFKSPATRSFFMDAVSSVHNKTDEFKKIIIDEHKKAEYNDAAFTSKLVEKLSPSTNSPLDKVRVAYAFARLISANDVTLNLSVNDEYISYLVNAINHVCLTVPDGD